MLLLPHLALVVAPSLSLLLSPRDGHHNNLRLPSSPLRRPILPRRRTSSSSRLLSSVAAGGGGGGSSSSTDTTAPAAVPSSATTPPSLPPVVTPVSSLVTVINIYVKNMQDCVVYSCSLHPARLPYSYKFGFRSDCYHQVKNKTFSMFTTLVTKQRLERNIVPSPV